MNLAVDVMLLMSVRRRAGERLALLVSSVVAVVADIRTE